eukprot:14222863-Alexandrium_andersonii.AAC.1
MGSPSAPSRSPARCSAPPGPRRRARAYAAWLGAAGTRILNSVSPQSMRPRVGLDTLGVLHRSARCL